MRNLDESKLRIKPQKWNAHEYNDNLLLPIGRAVSDMERTGIPVDVECLKEIAATMESEATDRRKLLKEWTGSKDVNWNSWQQLAAWLHDDLGLAPSPYWKKGEVADGERKTDDRALEWLAGHNPEHRGPITALRELRQRIRMGRYAREWLDKAIRHNDGTSRLHPSFGLASDHDTRPGAVTGRFGVKNPPLNQVPRNRVVVGGELRRAFVPPPGYRLIVVDYSQLEVVILAHLIAALFGDSDPLVQDVRARADIHAKGARFIFGELAQNDLVANVQDLKQFKLQSELALYRDITKTGIYGRNYGKGRKGFATSFFLPDGSPLGDYRADLLCSGLDRFYPGVPLYQEYIRKWIRKFRYIMTLFGRWQPMPGGDSFKRAIANRAWRQSLNYPMQGGGQEIMALALIAIWECLPLREMGFILSLVVHDEIVGFAPEEYADDCLKIVEYIMVTVVEMLAPLKAEGKTGANWLQTK